MPERGGGVYKKPERPYTRKSTSKPRKSYIKGGPRSKIRQYMTGNKKGQELFNAEVSLVVQEAAQIKDSALEAARIAANKGLEGVGANNYLIRLRVFPHQILRENPLATGAGADRFQEGMSRAFGKPIGCAASVKRGQKIMSIFLDKASTDRAKEAMRRAKMKMPIKCRVITESGG